MTTTPADLADLADRLGYDFATPELLTLALTHRSWCAEHAGHEPNERLEFLGDAVLGVVVTDHIFRAYPGMPEGELSKLRTALVSAATLAEIATELDLGAGLLLGKGEASSGGRERRSNLADALEAVIGAVYLDGGIESARTLVIRLLGDRIADAASGPGLHDFKSQLQELTMREFDELPHYELRDEGPDHEKRFFARVHAGGAELGAGEGPSKKQAEQAAAQAAWERLAGVFAGSGTGTAGIAPGGEPPAPAGATAGGRSGAAEGAGDA